MNFHVQSSWPSMTKSALANVEIGCLCLLHNTKEKVVTTAKQNTKTIGNTYGVISGNIV